MWNRCRARLRRRLVRAGVDVGEAHIGDLQLIAAARCTDRGAHRALMLVMSSALRGA
jgi:hypothetical protein